MFAQLVDNNFYLIDIFSSSLLSINTIHKNTFYIWYLHLIYLGHQNIIRIAYMLKDIDLLKTQLNNVFILYIEVNMQVEPLRSMI